MNKTLIRKIAVVAVMIVAFAILANDALFGICNNAPSATGAKHGVVMGRINL